MRKLPLGSAVGALGLALVAPAAPAADSPAQAPLAPRTAESGAPLDPVEQAIELPHLTLALRIDPASQAIAGQADYTVRAATTLDRLEFDLDPRLPVSKVTLSGEPMPADRWSSKDGLVSIALPAPLAKGASAQVGITYAGKPRIAPKAPWDGGFVWSKSDKGQSWIATAVQAEGCDLFWPCLDHPSKRVNRLDLFVTVPERLIDASNGKLVETIPGPGFTTFHWRAREPNGYGVSLQIGPYELAQADYASRFGNTVPIRFWYLPGHRDGAEAMVAQVKDFLAFFESTIGPYPWSDEKAGFAETPHLGMEHQTVNAYGNGFKLAPEGYDWLMQHEFSHEWFANQLTNAGNADMWLQEGLGSYMQPLYLRWKSGEAAYQAALWDMRKRVISRVPLAPQGFVSSSYYDDEEAGWGSDIYRKGAWVTHTLRETIGDKAFYASLRQLVYGRNDPRPGNFVPRTATTDDYRRIVERATGKPMSWFFDAYFRVAALPRLTESRDGATLRLAWQTEAKEPFAMPVEVEVDGRLVRVPMTAGKGSVRLPSSHAHVVLDPNARILRYDPAIDAWQKQEEDTKKKAAEAAKAKG
ncbi:MAG TPA: M1 family metallopeptidase [Croceibacterium sp.]|nr:M1 family metallopeptidase [Croceibacterium sp.]